MNVFKFLNMLQDDKPGKAVPTKDKNEETRQEFIKAYSDPRASNRLRWMLGDKSEADMTLREGIDRVKTAEITDVPNNAPLMHDFLGRYYNASNKIDLVDSNNTDNPTTLIHELTHSFQGNRGDR